MNNHKRSNREYYQGNKTAILAKRKEKYQNNLELEREKARVYARGYCLRHPELKEKRKLYTEYNRDKINEARRIWREKNKEAYTKYQREYYLTYRSKNKEKIENNRRAWRSKLRTEVLTYYGNNQLACVICGESRQPCLSIDHINNDGAKHRRTIKPNKKEYGGVEFYSWLKQNHFPMGYQTLCMNCQWVKKADYEGLLV